MAKTLYEKVFDAHVVSHVPGELPLLYVDRHLIHEVTSPQAFEGLRLNHRPLRRKDLMIATIDHDLSTESRDIEACSEVAQKQIKALIKNCEEFGVKLFGMNHPNQGIVHIIGPQLGFTLPGTTLVCGDSHTATHGAFGALAFGIGTSEVEHVMASQCIKQAKLKNFQIICDGHLPKGTYSKDLILKIAQTITTAGGTGYAIEFTGSAVKELSMEARMTLSNMAIEVGAKAGMIAPDQTTFDYLKNREFAPKGQDWEDAVTYWKTLKTDEGAKFDKEVVIQCSTLKPMLTWGTNPGQVCSIDDCIPFPASFENEEEQKAAQAALAYMGLNPGQKIKGIPIDVVFIGSCTNGRLEDLKIAAQIFKGRKVAEHVTVLVVPGSAQIRQQAEQLGLDKIFIEAGCQWRLPGCSMCLGMNGDIARPGQRVASTSNRNFVGRQGKDVRTHLMSPAMAAASAIAGCLTDPRDFIQ